MFISQMLALSLFSIYCLLPCTVLNGCMFTVSAAKAFSAPQSLIVMRCMDGCVSFFSLSFGAIKCRRQEIEKKNSAQCVAHFDLLFSSNLQLMHTLFPLISFPNKRWEKKFKQNKSNIDSNMNRTFLLSSIFVVVVVVVVIFQFKIYRF